MTHKVLCGLFLMSSISSAALAGPRSDGGGKGVLCTTPTGQTLEALDIYEAKNVYRFGEAPRNSDLMSEFIFGLQRFEAVMLEPNQEMPSGTEEQWKALYEKEFAAKIIEIPQGRRLPVTKDATIPVLPNGCKPVQIAVFNAIGVQLDKEYWNLLDARNKAAIAVHEMLYPFRRKYGATTSDETRRFVGQLFSAKPPTPRFLGIPKNGYLDCRAGGNNTPVYDFVVYPSKQDGQEVSVISFREIDNATVLGRMTATIPGRHTYEGMRNGEVGLSNELHSESRDETRSLLLHSKVGNSGIAIKVSTRDNYTGIVSTESTGFCSVQ